MRIGEIVNSYAREQSPYMNGLVNHLPMGQLALYMMGNDLDKIQSYSKSYIKKGRIDLVKKKYDKVHSIEECLGKRDLYEGCVDYINSEIKLKGMDYIIGYVLNNYPLGISSGLFHTIIRIAYGIEGLELDRELSEEVGRALAYYITAYRPGKKFSKKVPPEEFIERVDKIFKDPHIKKLISSQKTTGQQMKMLYKDQNYLDKGVLIEGSKDDKIKTLLKLLLPILDKTNNIVALHCITGLQALMVLEKDYADFNEMLDIITTFIITHLLTIDGIEIEKWEEDERLKYISWKALLGKASISSDVHTIKFTYSARKLYKTYKIQELKRSAFLRAKRN